MTNRLVEQAAQNNALWCDAVCAVHRGGGEFHRDFWLSLMDTPPLYPNLVTLTGSDGVSEQKNAIAELIRTPRREGWSIKDSFQSLDLRDLGFNLLFEAEWLSAAASPGDRGDVGDVQWTTISAEHGLTEWERAWRKANAEPGSSPLFKPQLLFRTDIRFVMAISGGCVGGGVLNAGAGVICLTNLFVDGIDLSAGWAGLAGAARTAFPGLPLIAYDRGEPLAAAHRTGLTTVGGLRVWRRRG